MIARRIGVLIFSLLLGAGLQCSSGEDESLFGVETAEQSYATLQLNLLAGPWSFVGSETLGNFSPAICLDYLGPPGTSSLGLGSGSNFGRFISDLPCSTVRQTAGVGWCVEARQTRWVGPFLVNYRGLRFFEDYGICRFSCEKLATVAERQACCAAECETTWIGFE